MDSLKSIVTKESVEAKLISEVTKRSFQELIEKAKNAVIDEQTISTSYEVFKRLGDIFNYLEGQLKLDNKPEKDIIDARKSAYDVYLKPLKELFEKFEPVFTEVNGRLLADDADRERQLEKTNSIMQRHIDFVKDTVQSIVIAPDNKELVRIQKNVGSEKSKSKFYGSYKDKIDKTCDTLLALIEGRKGLLKERAILLKEQSKWEDANDIVKLTEIKSSLELLELRYRENVEIIADSAYSEISGIVLSISETESSAISPRLHRWSWRIENPDLLYKKRPNLVTIEGNAKNINALIAEKKDELNKEVDNVFDGLILYYKQFYVIPPKS